MDAGPADEELMLRYAAGEAGAFDVLYGRHKGPLFRYLRRHAGNAGTAEEVLQDVWIRVINARDRYEPTARFKTWLYTIAHNRLMDHFRAEGRADLVSYDDVAPAIEDQPATGGEPDGRLERKQLAAQLLAALDALPAAQRETFVLQQEAELSVEEIAAATGVTFETAKSRLRYALGKLRKALVTPDRTLS